MRSAMRRFRQKFSCTSGGTGQIYSTIFRYSAGTAAVAEICVWNQLAETIAGTLAEPRWCECHGRSGPERLPSNASMAHAAPRPPSTIPRRSRHPVSVEGWDRLGQVDVSTVLVEPRLSCEVLLPVVLLSLHHHPRVRHRLRKRGPVSLGDLGPVRGLALGPPPRGRLGRVADPVLQVVLEGRVGGGAPGTSVVAALIVMAALLSQLH